MVMVGAFNLIFLWMLLLGDSGRLQDYVDTEAYWADLGMEEVSVEGLREQLEGPGGAPEEAETWIGQLGAASFEEREEATKALIEAGGSVRPLVEAAVDADDPEVRKRARRILEALTKTSPSNAAERKRMALLTLSRMEGAEAEAALARAAEGDDPETAAWARALRRDAPGALADRDEFLARFPAETRGLLHLRTRDRIGEVAREVRRSPNLQLQLREWMGKTGPMRIDRVTLAVGGDLFTRPPVGRIWLRVEGRFLPERISALLAETGLRAEADETWWTRREVSVRLDPDGTLLFAVVHPEGAGDWEAMVEEIRHLQGRGEGGETLPPAVRERIPAEAGAGGLWLVLEMPEDTPDLPGAGAAPVRADGDIRLREDQDFSARFSAEFPDPADAEAVREMMEAQLQKVRDEVAAHAGPETRPYRLVLDTVETAVDGATAMMTLDIPREARTATVQQMERLMGMMRQMQDRQRQQAR